mmetsp:Transcript_46130/g.88029  ORF Transcript_46130/g.88029 Transcript_46130/m.88029 type:complete len:247 (-) Transcript_46130:1562-2302(-)
MLGRLLIGGGFALVPHPPAPALPVPDWFRCCRASAFLRFFSSCSFLCLASAWACLAAAAARRLSSASLSLAAAASAFLALSASALERATASLRARSSSLRTFSASACAFFSAASRSFCSSAACFAASSATRFCCISCALASAASCRLRSRSAALMCCAARISSSLSAKLPKKENPEDLLWEAAGAGCVAASPALLARPVPESHHLAEGLGLFSGSGSAVLWKLRPGTFSHSLCDPNCPAEKVLARL